MNMIQNMAVENPQMCLFLLDRIPVSKHLMNLSTSLWKDVILANRDSRNWNWVSCNVLLVGGLQLLQQLVDL